MSKADRYLNKILRTEEDRMRARWEREQEERWAAKSSPVVTRKMTAEEQQAAKEHVASKKSRRNQHRRETDTSAVEHKPQTPGRRH